MPVSEVSQVEDLEGGRGEWLLLETDEGLKGGCGSKGEGSLARERRCSLDQCSSIRKA